jgi:branched-chain amino acid transport system substrate-binding protein
MLSRTFRVAALAAACGVALWGQPSRAADDTIKLAFTGPLSEPFAQVGEQQLQQMQWAVDFINSKGGALGRKFQLLNFDSKGQPAEELIALKSITDRNIPVLLDCSGSNVTAALIGAVAKHNARNPENRIVFLNPCTTATEFTNKMCSFWHFRFDANNEQKALLLVKALPQDAKKVYLLDQDYVAGQEFRRDVGRLLAQQRPDIRIVGDELVPLGKVKDFSPYISKIKASGAQLLITFNWGPDLTLLIKAGMDSGIDIKYYTLFAHFGGGPTAIGPRGNGKVVTLQYFNTNLALTTGDAELVDSVKRFRQTHDFELSWGAFRTDLELLQAAIDRAGSTDPLKIARALEGMSETDMLGREVTMRAEDHQLLVPYYVAEFSKDVAYDTEHTGLGWKVVTTFQSNDITLPTTCMMKRPAS